MDWKAAKKDLDRHFGKARKSPKEDDRHTLLHQALENAQKKQANKVQQVLDKHPEAAMHQHVKGWADGVKAEHLPKPQLEAAEMPDESERPRSAKERAAAQRAAVTSASRGAAASSAGTRASA